MRAPRETHYVPAFAATNGHQQQAVCGRWLHVPVTVHSAEPSCPDCRTWLRAVAGEASDPNHDVNDQPF